MKFPAWLKVYGDTGYRGDCPSENAEQITAVARIRKEPLGELLIHPRNEGKRSHGQAAWQKAEGMTAGAPDLIVPVGFVCELKRRDHTKSRWQKGQLEYLQAAHDAGAFVCVALGADAAITAYREFDAVRLK